MANTHTTSGLGLALLVILSVGCVSPSPTPARLYNLDTGDIIPAELGYSNKGHGWMTAKLPNGETCSGEYTVGGFGTPYGPPSPNGGITRPLEDSDRSEGENKSENGAEDEMTWAEIYGFGAGTYIRPAGSATLVGDRGTVLEIVIYSFYYFHGTHGDGVGRDNHGNWYRVHIGKVSSGSYWPKS
jgi:hypothetical protein